ncbi:MAG: hypothetical protein CL908_05540 [Deltaproteobacteria bacterium]|nr:hypothetical protein [Deltaproteobacteria bacterium]
MSADAMIRERVGGTPAGFDFEPIELVEAPKLSKATVAIVTTAGLARPGEPWADGSHAFRLFERDTEGLILAHNSTNFDRTGYAADRNVVYPIDRLVEMEAEGVIGRVAPRHASFLGSTFELSTFVLDTGPRLAKILREDGVDIAILTPV